jgi:methionyl-tRNA formyltransferase
VRVVFLGTPDFAVPALEALAASRHELLAVVAQPARPKGRGQEPAVPATVACAQRLGICVRQPVAVKSGPFPEWFDQLGADVAAVVAYGRILTPRLLAAPRRGCINVHASLLPRYRGAAPIQWAVRCGEAATGVCTMRVEEGLDTGPVYLEERVPIGPDETAGELAVRLAPVGARLLVETLDQLDHLVPRPQQGDPILAPPLRKEDGVLDWRRPAREVHDRVRGSNPWPGGQTTFRGSPLKVLRTRVTAGSGQPGEALSGPVVAAGDGAVELVEVQLPGRRVTSGRDFANGSRLRPGERLG